MARKNEGEDAGILSFIDVISCGMGAAVLLFLIFSAMPRLGSVVPSGQRNLAPGGQSAEDRPVGIQSPLKARVAQLPIEVSVTISGLHGMDKETLQLKGIPRRTQRDVITDRKIGSVAEPAVETRVFIAQGLNPANRVIGVRLPKAMLKGGVAEYCVNVRLISAEYYHECRCFDGNRLRKAGASPHVKLFNLYATRGRDKWIQIKVPGFEKEPAQHKQCPR